jgi:hypothetical protein
MIRERLSATPRSTFGTTVHLIQLNSVEALLMHVIQRIEKLYVYIFYVFVRSFRSEEWSIVVMTLIQSVSLLGFACGIAIALGHTPISIPKLVMVIEYFFIYAITQFVLMRGNRWRRYQGEFEEYSKAKATRARIAVWCGVVAILLAGIDLIKASIGAPFI